MTKRKNKSNSLKSLFLDRPTSHGGWPDGHPGSFTDPKTPVYKQIADYLKSMGLIDDDNPRARLSESYMKLTENRIRKIIRSSLKEALSNYPPGVTGREDYFNIPDNPSENADLEDIIDVLEEELEEYAEDLGYLQQYPHEVALSMTYNSDQGFFKDLYDEKILASKRRDY